ncbi:MAG: L,D-transpeptidase [Actinomycetota bacterium]|nr:L,D-transpeptidase [Actinomycetota bacterium]
MVRRRWVSLVGLVPAVVVAGCSQGGGGTRPALPARQQPAPVVEAAPPPAPPPAPAAFTVADAAVPSVAVYDDPSAPGARRSLPNPTLEGIPLSFLVRHHQGEWLQVAVPVRPNGTTGWVKAADVGLRTVPNRLVVELGARRLRAYHGDTVILEEPVAIGAPATPSPIGDFYVDAVVKLDNPNGPYGAYQLSVAGFSEVLHSFGGGIGQIAVHGTNRPGAVGQAVSNGCLRMTNEAVTRLADLAPVGTPVQILP